MRRLLLPLLAAFLSLALLGPAGAGQETPAYVALGDSLAFGVGASDPATTGYVPLAYDALRRSERYREQGLGLVNLGVPGATSADLLLPGGQVDRAIAEVKAREEDTSAADDSVEIISVDIGGNDLLSLVTGGSSCLADPTSAACQEAFAQMLATLRENLRETVRRLREAAPQAQIVIVTLYSPLSGSGGPLEVLAAFAVQQVNGVMRAVAAAPEIEAKLADVYDLFAGRSAQLVAADNLHPNDTGHAVIAEALLAAIEGREVVLPEGLESELATGGSAPPPAQPAPVVAAAPSEDDGDTDVGLLLAILVPAAAVGLLAIGGAYVLGRGRA